MECPTSSLIQFNDCLFDENENPSAAEHNLISSGVEQPQSPAAKVALNKDLELYDTSNNALPSYNSPKMPEFLLENVTNELCNVKNTTLMSDKMSDSGINDVENNVSVDQDAEKTSEDNHNTKNLSLETGKLLDITNNLNITFNGLESVLTEFNSEDVEIPTSNEVFHDAVQFFRDPSSLTFLETAGDSTGSPFNPRSSLFMNFDPITAKFSRSESSVKSCDLEKISEDSYQELQEDPVDVNATPIVNKIISKVEVSPQQSLGNTLISFDSPVVIKHDEADVMPPENLIPSESEPPKHYTPEELQQALKMQELSMQEQFIKKQQDCELERGHNLKEKEQTLSKQGKLCTALREILIEFSESATSKVQQLSEDKKNLLSSLESAEKENEKLKEDVKAATEDLQSVESTFADFHKRYEQMKSMLKTFSTNEGIAKQQMENMNMKLQEKEEMYNALQARTEEMVDKANLEVAHAKKAGDSQIAVLKAQLKKAELQISSLESDNMRNKIENDKLSNICDELMAKVSES